MNDLRRMRQQIVNYLRFAGFSVTALAMVAFLKLAPPAYAGAAEPREGDPPTGQVTTNPAATSEDERLDQLEAEVARLNAELATLRSALSLMGPLPDHADLTLAVDPHAGAAAEPPAKLDPLANITKSELFAPPPSLTGARSLFYEAELGSFRTPEAAEADWRRMARNTRLAGMLPRYTVAGGETRLVVGSLPSQEAAKALCVELSAVTGACRPVVPVRAY